MGEEKDIETLESSEEEPPIDFARKKRRILKWLLGWPALLGVTTGFLDIPEANGSGNDFYFTALTVTTVLPVLILAISWCRTDNTDAIHPVNG